MRGFRRAQLRGSDELFRTTEEETSDERLSPAVPQDHPTVTAVPSMPPPETRTVRLSAGELETLAEAVQHLKFPQKSQQRPSVDDFERLDELRQKLLDAL